MLQPDIDSIVWDVRKGFRYGINDRYNTRWMDLMDSRLYTLNVWEDETYKCMDLEYIDEWVIKVFEYEQILDELEEKEKNI